MTHAQKLNKTRQNDYKIDEIYRALQKKYPNYEINSQSENITSSSLWQNANSELIKTIMLLRKNIYLTPFDIKQQLEPIIKQLHDMKEVQ